MNAELVKLQLLNLQGIEKYDLFIILHNVFDTTMAAL